MTWGLEGTSHYLFASSEPHDDDDYNGFHRAFDMNRKKHVFDFDAKEAGDAMALDCHGKSGAIAYVGVDCYSAGERFVLFTRGPAGSHIMRMYDLRRKNKTAIWKSELEPFSTNSNGEVNHARFSPDTIYLAAARSDDVTHIYDSRMIGRGVLHAFEHSGAPRNFPGCETYGVVDLQWVESRTRRLGLVTGGIDGEFPIRYLGGSNNCCYQDVYGCGTFVKQQTIPRTVPLSQRSISTLGTFRLEILTRVKGH
jgi:WD40 repeat protein